MFEDEAFTIDEEADEYRILHPNAAKVGMMSCVAQMRLLVLRIMDLNLYACQQVIYGAKLVSNTFMLCSSAAVDPSLHGTSWLVSTCLVDYMFHSNLTSTPHIMHLQEKNEEGRLLAEHFEALEDEDGSDAEENDDDGGADDTDGSADETKEQRKGHFGDTTSQDKQRHKASAPANQRQPRHHQQQHKRKPTSEPVMYAAKNPASARAYHRKESLAAIFDQPLGSRIDQRGGRGRGRQNRRVAGSQEVSFMPSSGGSRGRGRGRGGRGRGRGGASRGAGRW